MRDKHEQPLGLAAVLSPASVLSLQEVCSNKYAIHPSIFLYRISKISHYAYCYTVGLRQLNCLGLMSGYVGDKLNKYDTVCECHSW